MRFGIILLWSGNPASYVRQVRLAEEVGFDWIGVGDAQSPFHDVYVSLALVAQNTSRAQIGPLVTNPLTRHPVVAAGAMVSIDALAPGRTFFGIGTGFSSVLNVGERPATRAHLRAYVAAVRQLLTGAPCVWQGKKVHLNKPPRAIPIYVAAQGVKSLRLAGQIGDGVVVHSGLTPDLVADAVRAVRQEAHDAGRNAAFLDIWALAKANVADDHAQAIDEIKTGIAASGYHGFISYEGKRVPSEMIPRIEELKRRYAAVEHQQPGRTTNSRLLDELGLADFLAERFAVVGTPQDCREKLRNIRDAGVHNVVFTGVAPDVERLIRRMGTEVIAALKRDSTEPTRKSS